MLPCCIWSCMTVCTYAHGRPEVNVMWLPPLIFTLGFFFFEWRKTINECRAHCTGIKPPGSPYLCMPSTGISIVHHQVHLFIWKLGLKFRVLGLSSKYFASRATSVSSGLNLVFVCLFFPDSISLCIASGCPRTHFVVQASLKLTEICLPSAGIKSMCLHWPAAPICF